MNISAIDKNFALDIELPETDIEWFDASKPPFVIHGAYMTSPRYIRIPEDVAEATNSGVARLNRNTAGIRARFRTNSPYIAICAEWDSYTRFNHMPASGTGGFDLYVVKGGKQRFVGPFIPPVADNKDGFSSLRYTELCEVSDYILNFPLYNNVTKLYIGVKQGSVLEAPSAYSNEKPVVFYGSSITQGGCASRPGNCYQNHISRALDMDYINLGFSGSGKGEKVIADYMATLDMAAFVCDYDYNAPDAEHLRKTHYPLYKTIREKNPELPIVILTGIARHAANNERRTVIMDTFCKAIAAGDKNVYFIDGAGIFTGDERDACTVDSIHPNDLGFYFMAQSIIPTLKKILFG